MLTNKNILLGVTGSIAAYKALEILRLFIKANANVKVILSEDAKRFVTPLSFEALSGNEVLHSSTESWATKLNHIKISKNQDAFLIAPATANSISKLSCGIADNLLLQTALAYDKKLLIAPAMNSNMYKNKATQKSLENLAKNHQILNPIKKLLACQDEGIGALDEPQSLFYKTIRFIRKDDFWKDKKVVITGGGTSEKIDDVRVITNNSSGKMANSLALALYFLGANVTLISSKPKPEFLDIHHISFSDTKSLKKAMDKELENANFLFMAAAVGDYIAKKTYNGKLKKANLGKNWSLELEQNIDLLSKISYKSLKTIGFKAEFDIKNAQNYAENMLKEKNLDAVCLNILGDKINFASEQTQMTYISKNGSKILKFADKLDIAFEILKEVENESK